MKYTLIIVGTLLLLLTIACSSKTTATQNEVKTELGQSNEEDLKKMKKIDIHTHYRYDRDYLIPKLEELNMQTLLVEVVKYQNGEFVKNWENYKKLDNKHKGFFYLCTGFNAYDIDNPEYAQNIIAQLDKEIGEGARIVKVWKNFGMVDKDNSGAYVQIDDQRLQPIWDFLTEKEIPVIAHIGEPIQAWLPIDTLNPHHGYFRSHPQYHAYLHPEIPHYDTIIAARDNWIARNPNLTILGAHLGSMAHSVDEISERLDKFPNFLVEPGARFGDLVRQDSRKVRAFFDKYQDRILYGSDIIIGSPAEKTSPESIERGRKYMATMLDLHWQYLTTNDSIAYDSPNLPRIYPTEGLGLSEEILQKVYYQNAAKLLKINPVSR